MSRKYLDGNGNPIDDDFKPMPKVDTTPEVREDEYGEKIYYYSIEQLEHIRHSIIDPTLPDKRTKESVFLTPQSHFGNGKTKAHGI